VTSRDAWITRLDHVAATSDWQLIALLAALLARDVSSDLLFVVGDGLVAVADEVAIDGAVLAAAELRALAGLVADEAARRRPAHAGVSGAGKTVTNRV
jgi:hypothetical protein